MKKRYIAMSEEERTIIRTITQRQRKWIGHCC